MKDNQQQEREKAYIEWRCSMPWGKDTAGKAWHAACAWQASLPTPSASLDGEVVGLKTAIAEYMDVVRRLFTLQPDGPALHERSVMKDDDALTAFDDLDAAGKAVSRLLGKLPWNGPVNKDGSPAKCESLTSPVEIAAMPAPKGVDAQESWSYTNAECKVSVTPMLPKKDMAWHLSMAVTALGIGAPLSALPPEAPWRTMSEDEAVEIMANNLEVGCGQFCYGGDVKRSSIIAAYRALKDIIMPDDDWFKCCINLKAAAEKYMRLVKFSDCTTHHEYIREGEIDLKIALSACERTIAFTSAVPEKGE